MSQGCLEASASGSWLLRRVVLPFVCAVPLVLSAPSLGDPYGQTEEAVNAAIWALGGRNLREQGPVAARFGANVAPFRAANGGIYAHHPPLPVWVAALAQVPGTWEGWPRLLALACATISLLMLFDILRLFVRDEIALGAVAVIATSPFVLAYGRLQTTLTLATPLCAFMLRAALRRSVCGEPWRWTFPIAVVAAVFSSWDGVLGAGAIVLYITLIDLRAVHRGEGTVSRVRALAPAAVGSIALAVLCTYLVWANGGHRELVAQAQYRMGADTTLPALVPWVQRQIGFIGDGLGWVTLGLLLGVPALLLLSDRPRGSAAALLLSAVPGVGMIVLFPSGSHAHAFWAYNLILPAAVAVALWIRATAQSRRRLAVIGLAVALGVQTVVGLRIAGDQLGDERKLNSVGALARDYFRKHPVSNVRMVSAYDFHPYVSWYLGVGTDVALSAADIERLLASGRWQSSDPVLVDREYARIMSCRPFPVLGVSGNRRWVIATAGLVSTACRSNAGS
jgi:hypothetical protein